VYKRLGLKDGMKHEPKRCEVKCEAKRHKATKHMAMIEVM